jgi:hypothetical protein
MGRVGQRGEARATPIAGGGRWRLGWRRWAGRREGGETFHDDKREEQRLGGPKEEEKRQEEEKGGSGKVGLGPWSTVCVRRCLTRSVQEHPEKRSNTTVSLTLAHSRRDTCHLLSHIQTSLNCASVRNMHALIATSYLSILN